MIINTANSQIISNKKMTIYSHYFYDLFSVWDYTMLSFELEEDSWITPIVILAGLSFDFIHYYYQPTLNLQGHFSLNWVLNWEYHMQLQYDYLTLPVALWVKPYLSRENSSSVSPR